MPACWTPLPVPAPLISGSIPQDGRINKGISERISRDAGVLAREVEQGIRHLRRRRSQRVLDRTIRQASAPQD